VDDFKKGSAQMKKAVYIFFAAWLTSAGTPTSSYPQGFGQNKVQYQRHRWQYIQSEHYDIYFYENGLHAAQFTAAVAESSYKQISRLPISNAGAHPILVYNSHNDFEETNVSAGIQEESVGGFTEFSRIASFCLRRLGGAISPRDSSRAGTRDALAIFLRHRGRRRDSGRPAFPGRCGMAKGMPNIFRCIMTPTRTTSCAMRSSPAICRRFRGSTPFSRTKAGRHCCTGLKIASAWKR
jgi:hypothetical protein